MFNLIRMNIYRLLLSKSTWIVFLVLLVMSGFSTYLRILDTDADISRQLEEQIQKENKNITVKKAEPDNVDFGIAVEIPQKKDGSLGTFLETFCSDLGSGLLLIFFTILCVLFVRSEDKSGFIKNIYGQTKYKANIYLAKIIPVCLYLLFSMAAYGLVQFVILKIHYGSRMQFGLEYLRECACIAGLQFFLHLAFVSGVIMTVTLFRSSAAAIALGILASCGFGSILTGALNKLLDISIDPWLLYYNINTLRRAVPAEDLLHAFGVGAVFFLLYNVIGAAWFVKRDAA